MPSDNMQVATNVIQSLGVLSTFALSFMVYRLTNLVARGESVRSINDGWAEYDKAMLHPGNLELFNSFLEGDGPYVDAPTENREHFLLYLLLNSLSNEYYSARAGTLEQAFADSSIDDYVRLILRRGQYVIALMKKRGYDDQFITFLDERMQALADSESATRLTR